jgi:hypothetical protein
MNGRIPRKHALLGLFATLAGCAGSGLIGTGSNSGSRSVRATATGSPSPQPTMVPFKTTAAPAYATAKTADPTTTDPSSNVTFQPSSTQPYLNAYTSDGTFVYQRDFGSTGPNGMPYFRITTSNNQAVSVLMPDITGVTAGSVLALGGGYTLSVDAGGYAATIANGSNTFVCSIDPVSAVATVSHNGSQLPTIALRDYPAFAGAFNVATTPAGSRRAMSTSGTLSSNCASILAAIMALLINLDFITHGLVACGELVFPPAIAACLAILGAAELTLLGILLYLFWQLQHCNDKPSPAPSPYRSPSPRPTVTATSVAYPAR